MPPLRTHRQPAPPECPECGCNATEIIRASERWGRAWVVFGCTHCSHQFSLGQRPRNVNGTGDYKYRVPFPKLHCPSCNGTSISARSSPKADEGDMIKSRYHQCNDCGCLFSSYEDLRR